MKLLELQIKNVRGIKALLLEPKGSSLVIWGPNGAGKSAVVDALDFLLTGNIPRLQGEGTRGISLSQHGPHVDSVDKPGSVWVAATLELPGLPTPVRFERSMKTPGKLKIQGVDAEKIKDVLALATRRQHSLSRREILRYVTSEGSKRADEIQAVLNLAELETTRKSLVRAQTQADRDLAATESALTVIGKGISTRLALPAPTPQAILDSINQLRATLGGAPLGDPFDQSIKANLTTAVPDGKPPLPNPQIIEREISATTELIGPTALAQLSTADLSIRSGLAAITDIARAIHQQEHLDLLRTGHALLDGSGVCPLCGHEWLPEVLEATVAGRLSDAEELAHALVDIERNTKTITTSAATLRQYVDGFSETSAQMGLLEDSTKFREWSASLNALVSACERPLERYLKIVGAPDAIEHLFSNAEWKASLQATLHESGRLVRSVKPEDVAWETLTAVEDNVRQFGLSLRSMAEAKELSEAVRQLAAAFQQTRDEALSGLYESIRERFVEFYRFIHGADEGKFDAVLKQEGAALRFEVDFYGKGFNPPHALHSEGHQDSMGLCLYLALAEHLTSGIIDLTILDDVVMSVDAGHRRKICTMLKTYFPNRQFIITTHDKTWAKQLQDESLVSSSGYIEFPRWSVDAGPSVETEGGLWDRIGADLDRGDVNGAAARLRNGNERFFETMCAQLRASVVYKSRGDWDLGDYFDATISALRKHLGKAKAAAQSWGHIEASQELAAFDDSFSEALKETKAEQWSVNPAVHFDRWYELSKEDFEPVCNAFRALQEVLHCRECGSKFYVTTKGGEISSVRCACGTVNWNLVAKKQG